MNRTTTIGIDLVDVADVREALTTFGDRYARRILTAREQRACTRKDELRADLVSIAFASKEAVIKTFGHGADDVDWLDIELTVEAPSRLSASLIRTASAAAGDRVRATISVSVAKTKSTVLAIAIAQGDQEYRDQEGEAS